MTMNTTVEREHEQALLEIARFLPPNRVEQLVDFARFLEAQVLSEQFAQEEVGTATEVDDARWDELLATDEGQTLLDILANKALTEHQAGKTRPMVLDNGRITPG